jgi:hypothetical protein
MQETQKMYRDRKTQKNTSSYTLNTSFAVTECLKHLRKLRKLRGVTWEVNIISRHDDTELVLNIAYLVKLLSLGLRSMKIVSEHGDCG